MEKDTEAVIVSTLKGAFGEVLEEFRKGPPVHQSSNPTITIHHADPPKVEPWHSRVSAYCCIAMFGMLVILGIMYLDLNRKYDRMQDYQNTTYMLVPEFRELVNQELEKRKEN